MLWSPLVKAWIGYMLRRRQKHCKAAGKNTCGEQKCCCVKEVKIVEGYMMLKLESDVKKKWLGRALGDRLAGNLEASLRVLAHLFFPVLFSCSVHVVFLFLL
ncbi:unnamed protein product [Cuscuta epithymum]|uniref:Uncharacterized protein n=1 Tax=Cuscuta epithymum TaxID=186058 RepID=A0AAV0EEV8_9ASTE|nr:unnamed protein product [Cuscuta epithymum]